jgi:hypothetical protein
MIDIFASRSLVKLRKITIKFSNNVQSLGNPKLTLRDWEMWGRSLLDFAPHEHRKKYHLTINPFRDLHTTTHNKWIQGLPEDQQTVTARTKKACENDEKISNRSDWLRVTQQTNTTIKDMLDLRRRKSERFRYSRRQGEIFLMQNKKTRIKK